MSDSANVFYDIKDVVEKITITSSAILIVFSGIGEREFFNYISVPSQLTVTVRPLRLHQEEDYRIRA